MTNSQLITLALVSLFLAACASLPGGLSQVRSASIDCRSVAPTGTKLKTKTVCGPQGGGQRIGARKAYDRNHDRMDLLGTRRMHDR